jgi:hypothetical protein
MRRNWLVAAAVAAIVVVIAAVVIMRVTDDDESSANVSTATWASSVCTNISDWESSISSLADVSGETLDRDSLSEKLDDAQQATETLVTNLKELGRPDTESGQQLQQELETAADDLESSWENLKAGAQDALDADSATAFLQALADLAPDVQSLLTTASTTLDTLENADVADESADEVQQAFEDSASCQELRSDDD